MTDLKIHQAKNGRGAMEYKRRVLLGDRVWLFGASLVVTISNHRMPH